MISTAGSLRAARRRRRREEESSGWMTEERGAAAAVDRDMGFLAFGEVASGGPEDEDGDQQTDHRQEQRDRAAVAVVPVAERGAEHVEGQWGRGAAGPAVGEGEHRVEHLEGAVDAEDH